MANKLQTNKKVIGKFEFIVYATEKTIMRYAHVFPVSNWKLLLEATACCKPQQGLYGHYGTRTSP
jgi:hypothetical protein